MKKKCKNFFDELRYYFENTPKKEILIAWKKASKWNDVGPTCDEYFKQNKFMKETIEKCKILKEGESIITPLYSIFKVWNGWIFTKRLTIYSDVHTYTSIFTDDLSALNMWLFTYNPLNKILEDTKDINKCIRNKEDLQEVLKKKNIKLSSPI